MALLYFHNPVFHKGRNLTIRRGVKWDVGEKENIGIVATNDPLTDDGEYKIIKVVDIETYVMRFEDLTDDDLKYEHEPICRTNHGLFKIMSSIFHIFNPHEIVTLIFFNF